MKEAISFLLVLALVLSLGLLTGVSAADSSTTYSLTMASDPEDYGTAIDLTGKSPYIEGTVVDMKAEANPGYRFTHWSTADGGTFGDENDAETTYTMPAQNVTVTANFEPLDYTLTIDSTEGGEVSIPGEGEFLYPAGEVVDLVAVAYDHYQFVEWSGDIDEIDDPASAETIFTMPAQNVTVTANFALVEYTLTIDSTEGGEVSVPGEGEFPYEAGTAVDLVAVADDHYQFVEWSGDIEEIDDPASAETTISTEGDYAIAASFAPLDYTLTIDSTEGGSVTVPGEGQFVHPYRTEVSLEAVAEYGYEFVEWTGDIDEIDDPEAAETTITMPGADVAVTASFRVDPSLPTVTTEAATNATTYSAILNMSYTMGEFSSVEVRFAAKRATDATWFHGSWVSRTEDGTYAYELTDLASQTEYEFKAQLRYDDTVREGDVLRFTTGAEPTLGLGLGCFIATAAYGTPTAEEIDVLREFRDVVLLESSAGSQFVALYYWLSPPVADVIAGNAFLTTIVRELLVDPVVWIVRATGEIWRD